MGEEEVAFSRLQVEVEGAMKDLIEEGDLLDWMERESVCLLGWDVMDVTMDELGLVKFWVKD